MSMSPGCHAVTGCDPTSSYFQIGKKNVYTKLTGELWEKIKWSQVGLSDDIAEVLDICREFVLLLYSNKKMDGGNYCKTWDQLWYILASTTNKTPACLPPTEDAFAQHVMRARLQSAIWCNSHIAKPVLWQPDGNGWKFTGEEGLAPNHVLERYCTYRSERSHTFVLLR